MRRGWRIGPGTGWKSGKSRTQDKRLSHQGQACCIAGSVQDSGPVSNGSGLRAGPRRHREPALPPVVGGRRVHAPGHTPGALQVAGCTRRLAAVVRTGPRGGMNVRQFVVADARVTGPIQDFGNAVMRGSRAGDWRDMHGRDVRISHVDPDPVADACASTDPAHADPVGTMALVEQRRLQSGGTGRAAFRTGRPFRATPGEGPAAGPFPGVVDMSAAVASRYFSLLAGFRSTRQARSSPKAGSPPRPGRSR